MKDPSHLEPISPTKCVELADSNSNVEGNEPVFWTSKLNLQVDQNRFWSFMQYTFQSIEIVSSDENFKLLTKIRYFESLYLNICCVKLGFLRGVNFSFRDSLTPLQFFIRNPSWQFCVKSGSSSVRQSIDCCPSVTLGVRHAIQKSIQVGNG